MNAEDLGALEPRQGRSRATRRRILVAANHLLRTRPFGTLSVQEIANAADCSIGAFYGRFRGKDDLIAPLMDRHYRGLQRGLRRAMASPGWDSMSLDDRLEWITRMTVWAFRSRRWLIRAVALFLRQEGTPLTTSQFTRRDEFARFARGLLTDFADEIGHVELENAIDFALFLITTVCRERVLFSELWEREWAVEGDDAIVTEVARAAKSYLTTTTGVRGMWLGA